MIKLKNRIDLLKMQEDDDTQDLPSDTAAAAAQGAGTGFSPKAKPPPRLSRAARSAIFREVVLAKVRDMKAQEAREKAERSATGKLQQPKHH